MKLEESDVYYIALSKPRYLFIKNMFIKTIKSDDINEQNNDEAIVSDNVGLNKGITNIVKPTSVEIAIKSIEESLLDRNLLKIGHKVGSGGFGDVYIAEYTENKVALKVIDTSQKGINFRSIKQEALFLKRLKHRNIVEFYGICLDGPFCIVMEYCEGGSLSNYLQCCKKIFAHIIMAWSLQIAKALKFMVRKKILHRDIKADNVLIKEKPCLCVESFTLKLNSNQSRSCICGGTQLARLNMKIADFGLTKTIVRSKKKSSDGATLAWMSPEALLHQTSCEKTEVWSYGVLLWEMTTMQLPYQGFEYGQIIVAIMNRILLNIPKSFHFSVTFIINQCWKANPTDRPTFEQLIAFLEIAKEIIPKNHVFEAQTQHENLSANELKQAFNKVKNDPRRSKRYQELLERYENFDNAFTIIGIIQQKAKKIYNAINNCSSKKKLTFNRSIVKSYSEPDLKAIDKAKKFS